MKLGGSGEGLLMRYHSSLIADHKIRSLVADQKEMGLAGDTTLLSQQEGTGLSCTPGNSSANDRQSQLSQ